MRKGKILLVDDEVASLTIFQQVFAIEGYKADVAESAEEALRLLREQEYPVMFFDIKMPGMNGIELFKAVKKNHPNAVVYVMTGYPTDFEKQGCLSLGFKDYFVKPVEFDTLLKAAEEGFRERRQGRA